MTIYRTPRRLSSRQRSIRSPSVGNLNLDLRLRLAPKMSAVTLHFSETFLDGLLAFANNAQGKLRGVHDDERYSFLTAYAIASAIFSNCSSVCIAEIAVRMRSLPAGTAGAIDMTVKTPFSSSARQNG